HGLALGGGGLAHGGLLGGLGLALDLLRGAGGGLLGGRALPGDRLLRGGLLCCGLLGGLLHRLLGGRLFAGRLFAGALALERRGFGLGAVLGGGELLLDLAHALVGGLDHLLRA